MPNGEANWYEEELPKLETFFARISEVLEDFAKQSTKQYGFQTFMS